LSFRRELPAELPVQLSRQDAYQQARARKAALRLQRKRADPTVTVRHIDPEPREPRPTVDPTLPSLEQYEWRESLFVATQAPAPNWRKLDSREQRRKPAKRRHAPTKAQLAYLALLSAQLHRPFMAPRTTRAASRAIAWCLVEIELEAERQK
jgi:hypothetical protein